MDEDYSQPTLDEGSNAPQLLGGSGDVLAPRDPASRWVRRGDLGWGGMGRVTLAYDTWLGREVALKEPSTEGDARLFQREAMVTARLEHPGIVPLYEAGRSPSGLPWFAMRVVRGRSLAAVLAAEPDRLERLRLLRHVRAACEAVAFAHSRGVVHRDLKSANIMVGAFGETQVIDWGLASAPGADLELPHAVVDSGGTARTMSPEQARGEPQGPASDVWSLGVLLWEVIAGRGPFATGTRDEALARIRAGRAPSLAAEVADAPPELVSIVERAMAPAAADRYSDASALAADLGRFVDGQLVTVHDYGPVALFWRFVRAWRVPLAVAALSAVVVAVLLAVGFSRIAEERDRSEANLGLALVSSARYALRNEARGDAEVLAAEALARAPLPEASGVLVALSSPRPQRELLGTMPCAPVDAFEERTLCQTPSDVALLDRGEVRWRHALRDVRSAVFYDHGRLVAVRTVDGVERFDAESGATRGLMPYGCGARLRAGPGRDAAINGNESCVSVLTGNELQRVDGQLCGGLGIAAFALHPDGHGYAALCKGGELLLGQLGGAAPERLSVPGLTSPAEVFSLAFMPDGQALLVGTSRGHLVRLDLDTRELETVRTEPGMVVDLEVDATGRRAIVRWEVAAPLVLDLEAGAALGRVSGRAVSVVHFAEDGSVLAAGDELVRWNFGPVLPRALDFPHGVASMAVSSDGSTLAIAQGDAVEVVDAATRQRRRVLRWGDEFIKAVVFDPAGGTVVAHGFGGYDVRRFSLSTGAEVAPRTQASSRWRAVVALPDQSLVVANYSLGVDRLFLDRPRVEIGPEPVVVLVATPDGRHVATLGRDRRVRLATDLHQGGRFEVCTEDDEARLLALTPSGDTVFVGEATAIVARCGSWPEPTRYAVEGTDLVSVAASDRWVAGGARDGSIWIWRRGGSEPRAVLRDHSARVDAVVVDPAERWLAGAGWDGHVGLYALPDAVDTEVGDVEAAWGTDLGDVVGIMPKFHRQE